MEARLVDAARARELQRRAEKFIESPLTFPFGLMIRRVLEELELWEGGSD